ncbi:MAG: DoxX family protein [Paludibacter sp.]|nr:DoxX family protein [Paludibacter sp.]
MTKFVKHRSLVKTTALMGTQKVFLHAIRLLIGFVFVFSGFVKAVDPLGTVYKIEDYLVAFGGVLVSLTVIAYPVAFLLIALEFLIGLNLIFQVRLKLSVLVAFLFMLLMTPLTLYIAIYNPVTDCGCFGDALKITNWQTFNKNVLFFILTLILIIFRKQFQKIFLPQIERVLISLFMVIIFGFMLFNLTHLPILDFRPYKVGVNIPEAMSIPEGAPTDVYEYNFIYEKDSFKQSFTLDQLPDSNWTFVSQESKLIVEGYKPPVHDFQILNSEFEDVTDMILSYKGKTYLLIVYDVHKASEKGMRKFNEFISKIKDSSIRVYALTASSTEDTREFKQKHSLSFPFYKVDPITLKTMIRANPGVMELESGTIKGKWNARRL